MVNLSGVDTLTPAETAFTYKIHLRMDPQSSVLYKNQGELLKAA